MEWLGGIELEATYSEDSGTFEGCREEVFRCTHCELSTSFAGHTTAIFTHCVLFGGLGFVFTSTFFDASGFVTSALVDTTNFFAGAFFLVGGRMRGPRKKRFAATWAPFPGRRL